MKKQLGFTLLEVLLAMTLLAAGMSLIMATLATFRRGYIRDTELTQRVELQRDVQSLLRRRLHNILPLPFVTQGRTAVFVGEPDRMLFVADLPIYGRLGGPHVHQLQVFDTPTGRVLLLCLPEVENDTVCKSSRRNELASGLAAVSFRYRRREADGTLGDWQSTWTETDGRMPTMIEIRIRMNGLAAWPTILISPVMEAGIGRG